MGRALVLQNYRLESAYRAELNFSNITLNKLFQSPSGCNPYLSASDSACLRRDFSDAIVNSLSGEALGGVHLFCHPHQAKVRSVLTGYKEERRVKR